MKKILSRATAILTLTMAATSSIATPPPVILFDNQSDVRITATIAGLPGKPIPPKTFNHPVPYPLVDLACFQKQVSQNCPIEFFDGATGTKIATVMINAETATVNTPPTIYGDYANQFTVTGWDGNPITHIIIAPKV